MTLFRMQELVMKGHVPPKYVTVQLRLEEVLFQVLQMNPVCLYA